LFRQVTACAEALTWLMADNNNAARMVIIAITTSSSMSVNALVRGMIYHPTPLNELEF
jgi:hypothetical protein